MKQTEQTKMGVDSNLAILGIRSIADIKKIIRRYY